VHAAVAAPTFFLPTVRDERWWGDPSEKALFLWDSMDDQKETHVVRSEYLKMLVYEAFATCVCGLKLLVYEAYTQALD
jgi:hypothetical protein